MTQPGYPLPGGELGEDEIVCQLVYLPDRPEYWQAFLAAYHYMTTWRAWERDADKRGRDAASNWRAAFELTMGCWRMTCLEQLQDDVAEILAIMQIPQACCDPGDITDGDQYTDRVEDGVGDVPQNIIDAGYASGTSDWTGFDDYKCMIAHVSIDTLEARLNEIAPLVDTAGGILGGVAALAGILAVIFGTAGLAVVFGIIAGLGATSLLYQAITDFGLVESLAAKVATNHDELACAIYRADGDTAALTALNAEIDFSFTALEALILKNMNMGPTIKSLYSGRYDQQDIAELLSDAGYDLGDFTCDCDQVGEYLLYTDFETETYEGWANHGGGLYGTVGRGPSWGWSGDFASNHDIYVGTFGLFNMIGETAHDGDKFFLHRFSFWYYISGGSGQCRLVITHDGGSVGETYGVISTWTFVEEVFVPPLEITHEKSTAIMLDCDIGSTYNLRLDEITIDIDMVPI